MSAQPCDFVELAPVSMDKAAVPFATEFVTLSRLEHIELVISAKRWKGLHERASERALWLDGQRLQDMRKARELFALCQQRHQQ